MSEAGQGLRGIVIAHGDMAAGMVTAVRHITGAEEGVLVPLSNRECSPEELAERIARSLEAGPAIVFTDLQTGSCGFAARRLTRDRPDIPVICGVNLPLLVDFVMNRGMETRALVDRLVEKGRGSIVGIQPTQSDAHGGSALSRG
jgi:mannose/fructose-specific phosphotransferase system component IIA